MQVVQDPHLTSEETETQRTEVIFLTITQLDRLPTIQPGFAGSADPSSCY